MTYFSLVSYFSISSVFRLMHIFFILLYCTICLKLFKILDSTLCLSCKAVKLLAFSAYFSLTRPNSDLIVANFLLHAVTALCFICHKFPHLKGDLLQSPNRFSLYYFHLAIFQVLTSSPICPYIHFPSLRPFLVMTSDMQSAAQHPVCDGIPFASMSIQPRSYPLPWHNIRKMCL